MAKPRSAKPPTPRDTSIATYRARRDFGATPEPAPAARGRKRNAPIFVVQKHDATRLHYDFRLEYGGVLWSWAVPKGPSLDPADKRLAVRTEDHPLDYADFAGVIPEGNYGAGTVEIWDSGTWEPQAEPDPDPARALANGEMKFILHGTRLKGGFVLVRLKPRPKERAENWLLIKEHDSAETKGGDAETIERDVAPPKPKRAKGVWTKHGRQAPPAEGAVQATMPAALAPQLADAAEAAPGKGDWLSEVKFDGYRLLAFKQGESVRLLTRNAQDWTGRMPALARAVAKLSVDEAIIDGELVVPREDGVTSFALLQQALSEGKDKQLLYYAFDLPFLNGWDLRDCRLVDRKTILHGLADWRGTLRYSDHIAGQITTVHKRVCAMGLEGIVCKQADAPYRSGRGKSWRKLKCQGREEFVVLGFTPPAGSRSGIGSLHLGYHDPGGALQYVGGVGSGFTAKELTALRRRLDPLTAPPSARLVYADEKPDPQITWVKPELVVEIKFAGWSGSGRVRQATYLGLREDKPADAVVRPVADPAAKRVPFGVQAARIVRAAAPSSRRPAAAAAMRAAPPGRKSAASETMEGVTLTHADRALWPGVTKHDLAAYWLAVAKHALPEIAGRPLALVRCPEGVDGERFFQKHGRPGFPPQIRAGEADGAPYLALEDLPGLLACAQVSAIELHAWGARESDALRPDRIVFDLDPGEGVAFAEVVRAAQEVRERLKQAGFESFCRTTGGKGLHVLASVTPEASWDATRAWCRAFAEAMAADSPTRFVSRLPKAEREGKILVDWLRNGLGSTAVASFSPRARPGATVATPLAWREVTAKLDPATFTLATVPARLGRQRGDPWKDFAAAARPMPAV